MYLQAATSDSISTSMRGKRINLAVLALALLVVLAVLLRREPAARKATQPARRPVAESEPPSKPPPEAKPARVAVPQAPAPPVAVQGPPGTVRGSVRIQGPVPPRKVVKIFDARCEQMHAGVMMSDQLVVDATGNVQWAFVHVKSGPIGTPPPVPTTPVLMDQIRCVFTPHM